jgi:hypothetical protein
MGNKSTLQHDKVVLLSQTYGFDTSLGVFLHKGLYHEPKLFCLFSKMVTCPAEICYHVIKEFVFIKPNS